MTQRQNSSRQANILKLRVDERGFTLAELLVVVGIFVLLVTLTVPTYISTRPQRMLSAETNRVSAVIRQGRLFALRDNDKVYLEFIPELDMYRLWGAQGWRAYADPINAPGELPGRHPELGDYDGDLDGDGDYWWGDGGDPASPSGDPEDPDVNIANRWIYNDTDGTYSDPDVLLMPSYPGNKPIRTLSPKLRITTDPGTGEITSIVRDFSDENFVAGDNIVPFEVDLRMRNFAWDPAIPIGLRNGVLSHFPLLFLEFFPDGTIAPSWDENVAAIGFADEVIGMQPGKLGATQIFLQIRSEDYNPEAYNLFDPTLVVYGDEGSNEPLSPYTTIGLDDSANDIFGRVIMLNNLTGRVVIRNIAPLDLDQQRVWSIDYL